MANVLNMAVQTTIITLWRRGWSQRRIARDTGISRATVARYVALARGGYQPGHPGADSNCAISTTGSNGSEGDLSTAEQPKEEAAEGPIPRVGRQSLCDPFRTIIETKLEAGLTAMRIWQDLTCEHGFPGGYESVKRFCFLMKQGTPLPFRRMECRPGEEAQIDFGTGALVVTPDGQPLPFGIKTRRRKTHVIRVVLSHSRKAYSEVVYRQTSDAFIQCIENAFHHFGGVPQTIVIDNLKAAVTKADWFDPEINPKFQSFCQHYGTAVLPTKPYTPRHKGKTERGVAYVQDNALKDRTFSSLVEQNRHLQTWESQVADLRIHGTTRKQVRKAFEETEKPALLSLPRNRFAIFHEVKRTVNRDGHIEVDKAYYSAPPEYMGRQLWVRWDARTVRMFNHRFEQVGLHAKLGPGQFATDDKHISKRKRSGVEKGSKYLLEKADVIGRQSGLWAQHLIEARGVEGIRPLIGFLGLAKKYDSRRIESACEVALTYGAYRLRTIRELIKRQGDRQQQFEFITEHPIIRQLSEYGDLIHTAFTKEKQV